MVHKGYIVLHTQHKATLAKNTLIDNNFIQSQIWPHRRLNKKRSLVSPCTLAVT